MPIDMLESFKVESKIEELSRPVRITVTEKAEKIKEKKLKIFESQKDNFVFDGFRKGHVPLEVVEKRVGKHNLYKSLVDDLYAYAAEKYDVVSASDFKVYGDFQDQYDMIFEFIAELKPTVELPNFNSLKMPAPVMPEVANEEIEKALEVARKEKETIVDANKESLESLDLAVIDFEGTIEGEKTPFKGGSAKNFKIDVNKPDKDGRKQFIDNFEDQMVGMKIGETREVKVSFPEDYRDTTKAGKKAIFKVTLHGIKKRILPDIDENFIRIKGFNSIGEYREFIKGNILSGKMRDRSNAMKRDMVGKVSDNSKISPIPEAMINDEIERQWKSMLNRIEQKEDDYTKKFPDARSKWWNNNRETAIEMLKTSLVLENVAKINKIMAEKADVIEYATNIAVTLGYEPSKTDKMIKDLDDNIGQYNFMRKGALNEKTVDFIVKKITE